MRNVKDLAKPGRSLVVVDVAQTSSLSQNLNRRKVENLLKFLGALGVRSKSRERDPVETNSFPHTNKVATRQTDQWLTQAENYKTE